MFKRKEGEDHGEEGAQVHPATEAQSLHSHPWSPEKWALTLPVHCPAVLSGASIPSCSMSLLAFPLVEWAELPQRGRALYSVSGVPHGTKNRETRLGLTVFLKLGKYWKTIQSKLPK